MSDDRCTCGHSCASHEHWGTGMCESIRCPCLAFRAPKDSVTCPLAPLGMPVCGRPAFYEMDIDSNEKWIPLCVEHGPMYRRSSNVRVRTRRPS